MMSFGVKDKFAIQNLARADLGQPVILCAPGPSLKPLERRPGIFIAAMTKAYPTVKPDLWIGMDNPACYDRRVWLENFIKITNGCYPERELDGRQIGSYPLTYFAFIKRSHDVLDIFRERGNEKMFCWYKHTLGTTCDILVWMGARRIYLNGFDLRHIDGKDYCDGARKTLSPELRALNQRLFDQQIHFLRAFHAYAEVNDVEVISCTPGSPLNEFMPYADLTDVLAAAAKTAASGGEIFHCKEVDHKSGDVHHPVRPFTKQGLIEAIRDAKSRKEREAAMAERRRLREESQAVPIVKPGGEVAAPQIPTAVIDAEAKEADAAKNPDTPENFRAVWARLAPPLVAAAMPLRRPIPMPRTEKPRIGFYFPNPTMLAHAVNYETLLRGLDKIGNPIEALTFTIGRWNGKWEQRIEGTRYCHRQTVLESYLELRARAQADHLSAMVYVSSPIGMAFTSTLGVAPRHIWWAHKWHGLSLPYLDGYLDACHPFRQSIEIDGRTWPSIYTAVPEMFEPKVTEYAAALRKQFPAQILFGTICREQKLTEDYARAVARILDAVPGSSYVYFGKKDQPWFEQIIGEQRIKFRGWVDTRAWSQVLDVYLDTFPFQSGHTALEAMAASKPVVWLAGPYDEEQGVSQLLGEDRWSKFYKRNPVSPDVASYISRAVTLAGDPKRRADDGAAGKAFIDAHMRDEARMAREFTAAVLEVIRRPDVAAAA